VIGLVLSALIWMGPLWMPEPAPASAPEAVGVEAEQLRTAKALFFDRRYAEARQAWNAVMARSSGLQASSAAYWVARCSDSLGQAERAFAEYGAFLERQPSEAALREEARTSRAALAARLVKQGHEEFRAPLRAALKDPSSTVRYFAAVQLAMLGDCAGAVAPILHHVLASETDDELLQRARLGLLRCDPKGLAERPQAPRSPAPPRGDTRFLKLRIFGGEGGKLKISINTPVSMAEILFKALPDEVKTDLRHKGYDADNFWEQLNRMPRGQILEIQGEDGSRIQLWIE